MEALVIENIRQEIMRKRNISAKTPVELKPASKFAYYNPAQKDSNGNIIIRQKPTFLWALGCVMIFTSLAGILSDNYGMLIITVPVLVVTAVMIFVYPDPYQFIVNKDGLEFENKKYLWKDFVGVYYFIAPVGKGLDPWALVLVRADGSYEYVRTEAINRYYKLGTAIRDFQPGYYNK